MKRVWRWFKRVMIGLVAIIVVTVAFALIAIHTDWGRNIVRGQVEGILAETFPGGATIGRIDGSPFGTLVITDVVLNGADGKPLVAVKRPGAAGSVTTNIAPSPDETLQDGDTLALLGSHESIASLDREFEK